MAKRFFYVCAGLLLLAGAFALGSRNAGAQSSGSVLGYAVGSNALHYVYLSNGDVYVRQAPNLTFTGPAQLVGNYFDSPTPVEHPSLGQVKARYR